MNTVVVRRNGQQTGRQARRRRNRAARRARRGGAMVVVQAPPQTGGRRRRGRRNRNRRRRGGMAGGGRNGETFVFSKDDLQGNSKGTLKFGPELSECPAFSTGILAAYHEYKITMVNIQFISEASSTSNGSISYELDAHCKLAALKSKIDKFGITKNGSRSFAAQKINGVDWHDSAENQFFLHYAGNGSATAAGSFRITFRVAVQSPK